MEKRRFFRTNKKQFQSMADRTYKSIYFEEWMDWREINGPYKFIRCGLKLKIN